MDRDQLAGRHTEVLRRHWRSLVDTGGQPTPALLEDLALVADEHGRHAGSASTKPADGYQPEHARPSIADSPAVIAALTSDTPAAAGTPPAAATSKPASTRKPAARRTTARKTPR